MLKLVFGLVVVVAFAVVSAQTPELGTAEELSELAATNVKACGATNKLSNEIIHKLHKPEDIARLNVDEPIKCFIKCLFDGSPIADKDDHLIEANFVAVSTAHGKDAMQIRKHFATCSQLYSTDANCDNLWKMYLCFSGMTY